MSRDYDAMSSELDVSYSSGLACVMESQSDFHDASTLCPGFIHKWQMDFFFREYVPRATLDNPELEPL